MAPINPLDPTLQLDDPLYGMGGQGPTPLTSLPGSPTTNQPQPPTGADPNELVPPLVLPSQPQPQTSQSGSRPEYPPNDPAPPTSPAPTPEPAPSAAPPAPTAPPAANIPPPAPTNTGSDIPWSNGATQPNWNPAGFVWDPTYARYVAATGGDPGPTGGKLSDPAYDAYLINWWAQQPGADPSLKNDPNYWINKLETIGGDQGYWESRFLRQGGDTNPPPTTPGSGIDINSLIKNFGNPVGPDTGPAQATGTDPFSQLIAGGYGDMLGTGGVGSAPLNQLLQRNLYSLLNGDPSQGGGTAALESARGTFNAAHNSMLSTAEADLANRGLMSEPGSPQGPETTSIDYIMRDLAPAFDQSMGTFLTNAYGQASNLAANNNSNFLSALSGAGTYQNNMGNLALNTLKENDAVNEFAAQYGLSIDQLIYQIASGQNTGLLNLLAEFLASTNTAASGHV